jgi:hypothetical protein
MHCWHQIVSVYPARSDDEYGDVVVDTKQSMAVFREWLARARPADGELRRPLHFKRVVRPVEAAYRLPAPG